MDESFDARLLAALRAGDGEAWWPAAERWAAPVFDHILRLTDDPRYAARLTVDAFQLAADSLRTLPVGGTLRAHFFGAAWQTMRRSAELSPAAQHLVLDDLRQRQGLSESELGQALHLSPASAQVLVGRLSPVRSALATAEDALAPLPAGLLERLVRAAPPAAPPRRIGPPLPPSSAATAGRGSWILFAAFALLVLIAAALFVPASPISVINGDGPAPAAIVPSPTVSLAAGLPTATKTPTVALSATVAQTASTPASSPSPTIQATATPGTVRATPTLVPAPTTVVAAATATATPTAAPPTFTATPSASPTRTPTTCVPRLFVTVDAVTVPPGGSVMVPVFNTFCGSASFTVIVIDGPWLQASPPIGTLASGGSALITLIANPPAEPGEYIATLRITGAANTINVPVSSRRP